MRPTGYLAMKIEPKLASYSHKCVCLYKQTDEIMPISALLTRDGGSWRLDQARGNVRFIAFHREVCVLYPMLVAEAKTVSRLHATEEDSNATIAENSAVPPQDINKRARIPIAGGRAGSDIFHESVVLIFSLFLSDKTPQRFWATLWQRGSLMRQALYKHTSRRVDPLSLWNQLIVQSAEFFRCPHLRRRLAVVEIEVGEFQPPMTQERRPARLANGAENERYLPLSESRHQAHQCRG